MTNQQLIENEKTAQEEKAKYLQRLKFCIISSNKTISSRNSLLIFTMENKF